MVLKIAILSDVHLFHKNSQPDLFHRYIKEIQEKVDIIVDCGDILDSNIIDASQSYKLKEIFNDIKIPYHIVMGNHDSLNGVSLASLLSMNKNIFVHNNIDFSFYGKHDTLLYIPYTNNIKELYKILNSVIIEQPDYVFSHLNITDNFYSDISFSNLEELYKYCSVWFNGHIHQDQKDKSIFGDFYNVGSFSSLTYGDEHIPKYLILDTETKLINEYIISGSIIHKTITAIEDFDFASFSEKYKDMKINWRIKIPNNFFVEKRNKIKEQLMSLVNTNNIQFDYIKTNLIKENISQNYNKKQVPLIQQLFEQFKKDTDIDLDIEIKKALE